MEPNPVLAEEIKHNLQEQFEDKKVLVAHSAAEATPYIMWRSLEVLTLDWHPIDFILIETALPDGNGLHFISQIQDNNKSIKYMAMTTAAHEEDFALAEALGGIYIVQKPLNYFSLAQEMRRVLSPDSLESNNRRFKAILQDLSIIDVVQLSCMTMSTKTLKVAVPTGGAGLIQVAKGNVVHAECGSLKGVEAFYEIASWTEGVVEEFKGPMQRNDRTINTTWQSLLMHAVHHFDEKVA
ncbi:MAG: response regulator [Verrucomicrobiae bacterium]|nr:response regulator [Verrucomicrobiae bacterium]